MQDAVIYARYSSHAQRDVSIEQQVAECEAYAAQNDLNVVKVYADRHLSGTTDKRPQFQQMLRDSAHARWKFVICWKIDRFARNRYDSATYKFRLKKAGVQVLYAKEAIPDGPEGILLESILEGSAEYYSANLSQNVRRGMMYNAEHRMVVSRLPLGYCRGSDGCYAVVEEEAEVVREIFRRVADGDGYLEIADDLNTRRIRTKTGGLWNKSSFHVLLKNDIYIGTYRGMGVVEENVVPPIVDRELFLSVRQKLTERAQGKRRPQGDEEYLLTGKLFCGRCGAHLVGVSGTGKGGTVHHYYACMGHIRGSRACPKKNVRKDWLEREVARLVLQHVVQPDIIEWIADQAMAFQAEEASASRVNSLREELADAEVRLGNVLKAVEMGVISESLLQRLADLEKEKREISDRIHLEEAASVKLERDVLVFFLSRFSGLDPSDADAVRKIIGTFVHSVYLTDSEIRIAFNFRGPDGGGGAEEVTYEAVMAAGPDDASGAECSYNIAQGVPYANRTNTVVFINPSVFVLISPVFYKR